MLEIILGAAALAFASAWQPGPLQAFYLSRIASIGWRRTLPSALAPLVTDGPIAALILLVLHRVPEGMEKWLQIGGGLALLFFAGLALREWLQGVTADQATAGSVPRTLAEAVVVNALNPGPWLGWSLVLGPWTVEAWRSAPGHAVALVAAFYVTLLSNLAAFILLLGATGFLGPHGRRRLHLGAAAALAGLGVWRLVTAFV